MKCRCGDFSLAEFVDTLTITETDKKKVTLISKKCPGCGRQLQPHKKIVDYKNTSLEV